MHEPAHAYLRMIRELSQKDGASDVLKQDHSKILNFLGAKDGEELTQDQEEKWAKAAEEYMREGHAPSAKLRGTFQRLAAWLYSVYKNAAPLVELTDEIRGVFDRMHAGEESVDRAAQEAGKRLFASPEEAGWTDEEFQKYAEEHSVSVEQAKSHILGLLNEAAMRERSEVWREEERNVRDAVRTEVDQSPIYTAIRSLRKGELDDGTRLTLDKKVLVEQFGEERVAALQRQHRGLYRLEGGAEPETVAEIHGFGSAEEMLRALESAPRREEAIETGTRDYMTAKHGDIRYDGSLADKANLAIANDERATTLHKEMVALSRRNTPTFELRQAQRELDAAEREQKSADAAQRRLDVRDERIEALKRKVETLKEASRTASREQQAGNRFALSGAPMESYREAAHHSVEAKAVADIQPTRYLDASRKYSREAMQALSRGDYYEAQQAKHKELMNHFLFREATKAKEFVGKFESYAKRMQMKGVQQKLGLAGEDYRDQFNRLLGRFALGPAVAAERSLGEWAAAQYERGKEPAIATSILNESRSANYRNAPISELRDLHDALVNVRKLAMLELGMEVNGRRVEFNVAVESMAQRA